MLEHGHIDAAFDYVLNCDVPFGYVANLMHSRCPSSILHFFCSASFRNTSPKCFRRLPYNTFRRDFGINTTWYLHSHFEWLKLSKSSIQFLLEVCLAAHDSESLGGLTKMSNFYCLPG